jgi:UDP-N-acetylmuramoyl-L-alanyl-D-glutamate--2,6-diaminopimelate ligase
LLSRVLPDSRFIGCEDIRATRCTDDAAACRPGDVFVARLGDRGDGHDVVPRAVARGAAAVVAERMVATGGVPLCLVPESDWAHARLAHALAGDPSREMRVIAVTGTSGKTTTAWLTASVLAEAGLRVGVLSDLGCIDADATEAEQCDYGRPEALARWLARLAADGCSHAVVEVSSRMLAGHALAGVECDTVAVTNISRAHLDLHGTAAAYRRVKARILDSLAADGCLVAAGDGGLDGLLARAAGLGRGVTCLTTGLGPECDLSARAVERSLFGQTFLLSAGAAALPVTVETPVTSFVRNALTAAAVGLRHGVPLEMAVRGLEAAGSVAGRLERLDRGQDLPVFIDSPASVHALSTTLASLRRLTPGRLAVIADEGLVDAIGGAAVRRRLGLSCDACVVVPATMMDDEADARAIAAYARVDRLLSGLGARDCLVVVGGCGSGAGGPGGPAGRTALATVVDGWLRLAHPPRERLGFSRRAA